MELGFTVVISTQVESSYVLGMTPDGSTIVCRSLASCLAFTESQLKYRFYEPSAFY